MRILVTGSRTWTDVAVIREHLVYCVTPGEEVTLVHGDCPRGADFIANEIAIEMGWTIERHPAKWNTHGRSAGYIRNAEMVKLGADIFFAFIKDQSKGASMCADLAEKAGLPGMRVCQ